MRLEFRSYANDHRERLAPIYVAVLRGNRPCLTICWATEAIFVRRRVVIQCRAIVRGRGINYRRIRDISGCSLRVVDVAGDSCSAVNVSGGFRGIVSSLRSIDVVTCILMVKAVSVVSERTMIGPVRSQCPTVKVGVSSRRTPDISAVSWRIVGVPI